MYFWNMICCHYCIVKILYRVKFIEKCFKGRKIYTGCNRERQYKIIHIEIDSKMKSV